MNVGAFTCWLGAHPLGQVLDFLGSVGIKTVEIGTGGYPGDAHAKPAELLADTSKLAHFRHELESRGMAISALSCMGNPLHPNLDIAPFLKGSQPCYYPLNKAYQLSLDQACLRWPQVRPISCLKRPACFNG